MTAPMVMPCVKYFWKQMNTATMESYGISADGEIDIRGIINRQTKTLTPVESWEEKL